MIKQIKEYVTLKQLEAIVQSKTPVFVKFDTPWCGVCIANQPMLDNVIARTGGPPPRFVYVDADREQAWAEDGNADFALKLVPTYMTFRDGKKVWEKNNFVPEPELNDRVNEIRTRP